MSPRQHPNLCPYPQGHKRLQHSRHTRPGPAARPASPRRPHQRASRPRVRAGGPGPAAALPRPLPGQRGPEGTSSGPGPAAPPPPSRPARGPPLRSVQLHGAGLCRGSGVSPRWSVSARPAAAAPGCAGRCFLLNLVPRWTGARWLGGDRRFP